jgi:hypothetical protein
MRIIATTAFATAVFAAAALGKDLPSYPEGRSMQKLDDHMFDLIVPKAAEVKPPYSLLVVLAGNGQGDAGADFTKLIREGFVVLVPMQKLPGGMWATSEVKDVLDDVEQICKSLPIAKDRQHVLTTADHRGFASFVAFDKRAEFASFALDRTVWVGASPSSEVRNRLAVLSMGKADDPNRGDAAGILKALGGKVRTLEYRADTGPFHPYYRYWLWVAEGRFKPGYDLSFEWIDEVVPNPGDPGSGSLPKPGTKSALDVARSQAQSKGESAFVYFYSDEDMGKPEAKTLQNDVFFDPAVRAAAKSLVMVKLEREKHQETFAALGLKTTPAIVIVDAGFDPIEKFDGVIATRTLAKSMTKAGTATKRK